MFLEIYAFFILNVLIQVYSLSVSKRTTFCFILSYFSVIFAFCLSRHGHRRVIDPEAQIPDALHLAPLRSLPPLPLLQVQLLLSLHHPLPTLPLQPPECTLSLLLINWRKTSIVVIECLDDLCHEPTLWPTQQDPHLHPVLPSLHSPKLSAYSTVGSNLGRLSGDA